MKTVHASAVLCWLALMAAMRASGQEAAPEGTPPAKPTYEEAVAAQLATVPLAGSQTPVGENRCAACHTEPALWGGDNLRLFVSPDVLKHDIHWTRGVVCQDCHGGNHDTTQVPTAHAREDGFRATRAEVQQACAHCHQGESKRLQDGLHAHAGPKNEQGVATALACLDCHGPKGHGIRATHDPESPLFLTKEIELCGKCHEQGLETYMKSVHGLGLFESGLAVSAICSSCHDPHGPLPVSDPKSGLHAHNVTKTCGKCHLFIAERLDASVHAWKVRVPGGPPLRAAPGGTTIQRPVCTSCHQGHDIANPKSVSFRELLPNRCGNCHVKLSEQYHMSIHGQLTNLGHAPAAKCSDCHGSHEIEPIDDPRSRLFGAQRLETCRQCHTHATMNFTGFDPHADYRDPQLSPILHYVYLGMETLLYTVFGFFGLHTLLWLVRSIIERLRHGRPARLKPGQPAYVRFQGFHRAMHVVVIVSFLGLALTGLPLRYSEQPWAQDLARSLGGFKSTSFWHRVCALVTISYFATHLVWLVRKVLARRAAGTRWVAILWGPDSPVPSPRDLRDLLGMVRWFFGLGKKPTFERWTYWEKFDYWAVFWGVGIIGTSGLMLWMPELVTRVLPGQVLNIAKVIHSEEALLATGFIFTIHFFNTHLRTEKFPMDMSMLTGLVSKDELKEERPEQFERMRKSGQLRQFEATTPSRTVLWLTMLGGFIALAVGLALLVGILAALF